MARSNPENEIVREGLDLLFRLGIPAWRNNNTRGHKADFGHYKGWVHGPWSYSEETGMIKIKGSPDIIAILPPEGTFLGLEAKKGSRRLSPDQEKFRDMVHRAGGFYFVFRTIIELEEILIEECGIEENELGELQCMKT